MEELLGANDRQLEILDLRITAKELELKALQLERTGVAQVMDPAVMQNMVASVMSQFKGN